MISIQQSIRNNNNSPVKSVLLLLLIACFILSTCSLRKGILSFFSSVSPTVNTQQLTKNTFSKDKVVPLSSLSCAARVNSTDGEFLFKVPDIQKSGLGIWLFFILPAFLCTVFLFKRNPAFSLNTIPDLSGSSVPLFIKNRLLRI